MRLLCIRFFYSLVTLIGVQALSAEAPNQLSPEEKANGWKLLFDGQTHDGWHTFKKTNFPTHGGVVEDGWLHCLGQSNKKKHTNNKNNQKDQTKKKKQEPKGNS